MPGIWSLTQTRPAGTSVGAMSMGGPDAAAPAAPPGPAAGSRASKAFAMTRLAGNPRACRVIWVAGGSRLPGARPDGRLPLLPAQLQLAWAPTWAASQFTFF